MSKIPFLTLVLALALGLAHADALEVSGFGAYTTLDMKQVNAMLAAPKGQAGYDQTTTTDITNGYMVGLDVRSGLLAIPFMELGLRGEYIGTNNNGEASGTNIGGPYQITEDPSMSDLMLGLEFGAGIPDSGIKVGLSAYGGYGKGAMQQSYRSDGSTVPDYYSGGGFVAELEARLGIPLMAGLNLYALGGLRFADLGVFTDSGGHQLGADIPGENGPPQVDFTGLTAGLGLNFDF